jgi:hypothetical protein
MLTIHRGLPRGHKTPDELECLHSSPLDLVPRRAGWHWTTDPEVADQFAFGGPAPEHVRRWMAENDSWAIGCVLTAQVGREHVVEKGSREWDAFSDQDGVLPDSFGEAEVTVRPGAPVHLVAVDVISDVPGDVAAPAQRRSRADVKLLLWA